MTVPLRQPVAGRHQSKRSEAVTPRDPPQSTPAGQGGDDFQKIQGIGAVIDRRLHDAGILTYQDLAARTPEQIAASLAGVAGLSAARIASQDWAGQAGQLARPAAPPMPSEPDQHYASFHIELLLDVDNSVRRTKVHHHQSDTDETWPGWDEDRLLALLRRHIPPMTPPQPAKAADLPPGAAPATTKPEMAVPSGSQPETASPRISLSSSSLRIEELSLIREGQRSHSWPPGEPTSIRATLRVSRTSTLQAAAFDFTAEVTASSKLGDNQRWTLGTVQGVMRVDEPLSVELTGQPLPRGLYRLEAAVLIYPIDHTPESQPIHGRRTSGKIIQVADAACANRSGHGHDRLSSTPRASSTASPESVAAGP
jgi:predicted flap endonuclease-1-like 5' DNA nuclease